MKILCLRCKNIHSLKGEHMISFDKPPLSDAGLFAITGPTGSGKSTLLDVITLALFNKIPRFTETGKETVTKNEIERAGSVMTHHTDHSYAEIDYEADGRKYRSTWSISKTKNGTLRDYEMTLATLPEKEYFDLKKSQVPSKNEEILHLTYDQFIRSILLSQGQFAKLLKSDEKERAKLLENITGTSIYRQIGKTIYQKARAEEKEQELLQKELDLMPRLTDEEEAFFQNQTAELEELLVKLRIEADAVFQNIERHNQFLGIKSALENDSSELLVLEQNLRDLEPMSARLQRHEQLQPLQGTFALWENARSQVRQLQSDIEHAIQKQSQASGQLAIALDQVELLTGIKSSLENYSDQVSGFVEKVRAIDLQLQQLEIKGKEANDNVKAFFSIQTTPEILALQSNQISTSLLSIVQKMLSAIELQPQFTGTSDQALEYQIAEVQEKLPILAREREACRQKDGWVESLEKLDGDVSLLQQQTAALEEQFQKVTGDAQKIRLDYLDTKTQKEKLFHAKDLDSYRELLSDGSPCPLCGATHHPFADHSFQSEYGTIALRHDQLEQLMAETEKSQQQLEKGIAANQAILRTHLERISEIRSQIESFVKQWPHLDGTESTDRKWTETQAELTHLQFEVKQRSLKSLLSQLVKLVEDVIHLREQYIEVSQNRKALCQIPDVADRAGKIQKDIQAAREELHAAQIELEHKQRQKDNVNMQGLTSQQQLMAELQTMGYLSPEDAVIHMMDAVEYSAAKESLETLRQRKTEAETRKNTHQKQLEELQKTYVHGDSSPGEWQPLYDQLQHKIRESGQQLGVAKSKLAENQQQLELLLSKKAALNERIKKASALFHLDRLLGDSEGNKYAKFAQNLSLQQLISLANKRLARLTDRYLLVPTDIELDMRISDQYQGGIRRSVKTLSGGETFLVSLALALSLSDMASHNVRLDSLFIDEGFGTLDNETLDVAIASLEKLQSETNRTIGIISHVESLKERMTTQIKVQKNSHGYSQLVIE